MDMHLWEVRWQGESSILRLSKWASSVSHCPIFEFVVAWLNYLLAWWHVIAEMEPVIGAFKC
ncbi:Serpin-ZX [Corchorus olitorius]|uniref:Serpin-ZX n=1 Tax=Corchorus olitorius TaxID=93759 RepID=A0A1R3IJ46_9ROSI|nr:Serpin-ZX [Corchorus olitorius]